MMVTVKLFATLREGRFNIKSQELAARATVRDVIKELDIPEAEVALILINSRHSQLDQQLNDGDTLALFPPVGGG